MAITPSGVSNLVAAAHTVCVEVGAGLRAGFSDEDYRDAGATVGQRSSVIGIHGFVVMVHGPTEADISLPEWQQLGPDHTVVSQHDPLWLPKRAETLALTGACSISLELIPRTTKAQSMDVLSAAATVAGYEAAILAAGRLQKLLPMLMTAAGTVLPAHFVVLGAGVAGLQAIATARRLGAVVSGYDIRPEAREQIRSLGAKAIELDLATKTAQGAGGYAAEQSEAINLRQHKLLAPHVAQADVVITTAAIPGAASPELITTEMVERMRPGSVIIDLAAARGGNCTLTVADEEVTHEGVLILGPTDLTSRAAATSSQMFSNNVVSLLHHLIPEEPPDGATDGALVLDMEDEIIAGTVVSAGGAVVHPGVLERLAQSVPIQTDQSVPIESQEST